MVERVRNWAGNVEFTPSGVARPGSVDELQQVVADAAAEGRRVRAIGAAHSFSEIVETDGVSIATGQLDRVGGRRPRCDDRHGRGRHPPCRSRPVPARRGPRHPQPRFAAAPDGQRRHRHRDARVGRLESEPRWRGGVDRPGRCPRRDRAHRSPHGRRCRGDRRTRRLRGRGASDVARRADLRHRPGCARRPPVRVRRWTISTSCSPPPTASACSPTGAPTCSIRCGASVVGAQMAPCTVRTRRRPHSEPPRPRQQCIPFPACRPPRAPSSSADRGRGTCGFRTSGPTRYPASVPNCNPSTSSIARTPPRRCAPCDRCATGWRASCS